jgi:hypothetical protein
MFTALLVASDTAMVCAGIDVAKNHLNLVVRHESGEVETRRIGHDPKGQTPSGYRDETRGVLDQVLETSSQQEARECPDSRREKL